MIRSPPARRMIASPSAARLADAAAGGRCGRRHRRRPPACWHGVRRRRRGRAGRRSSRGRALGRVPCSLATACRRLPAAPGDLGAGWTLLGFATGAHRRSDGGQGRCGGGRALLGAALRVLGTLPRSHARVLRPMRRVPRAGPVIRVAGLGGASRVRDWSSPTCGPAPGRPRGWAAGRARAGGGGARHAGLVVLSSSGRRAWSSACLAPTRSARSGGAALPAMAPAHRYDRPGRSSWRALARPGGPGPGGPCRSYRAPPMSAPRGGAADPARRCVPARAGRAAARGGRAHPRARVCGPPGTRIAPVRASQALHAIH